jgi:hypothetical protein
MISITQGHSPAATVRVVCLRRPDAGNIRLSVDPEAEN